jgi:hypothetical protein
LTTSKADICRQNVFVYLLGSTLKLAGQYTISCWRVHYLLLGSTLSLVGQYTMFCWAVHYVLLGSTLSPLADVFRDFAGVLCVQVAYRDFYAS